MTWTGAPQRCGRAGCEAGLGRAGCEAGLGRAGCEAGLELGTALSLGTDAELFDASVVVR
ncbi:hypothetical protein [Nonomuraea jiangxiensis]|uniref:hypothetical protein n=1 Tax=Nonomuraea jiangxiensis TaxID=633440 RepID=UPI001C40A495|nr:hypothetical protein [Nonomuraea jiangxiensis]